jgi:hypothetical protein
MTFGDGNSMLLLSKVHDGSLCFTKILGDLIACTIDVSVLYDATSVCSGEGSVSTKIRVCGGI